MVGSNNVSIIPDLDKPHALGVVLFRLLPDKYITGLQRVILRIMELNPELASRMPVFEDNRKFKLPMFAGIKAYTHTLIYSYTHTLINSYTHTFIHI